MAPLGLPAIGFINWATVGRTVTASSVVNPLVAANVLTDDINERWQSLSDAVADFVQVDLGGATPLGYSAIIKTSLSSGSSGVRLRLGTTSGGSQGYDSLAQTGTFFGVDAAYGGLATVFLPANVSARYVRWDVPDGAYVGKLVSGPLLRFSAGYSNFAPVWEPRSISREVASGAWHVIPKRPRRGFRVSFPMVTIEEAFGGLEAMVETVGDHTDVLFCRDLSSTNRARDTIWGRMTDLVELDQSYPDFLGAEFTIWERL